MLSNRPWRMRLLLRQLGDPHGALPQWFCPSGCAAWREAATDGSRGFTPLCACPLIQKRAVDVPPVLTLAAVMLFGALFGALGLALATPLVAALKVAVARLYVKDRLGGG